MATETVHPPDTNGRGQTTGGSDTQDARKWHEWLAVGVGLAGLISIGAIIISVVALSSKTPTAGPSTVTVTAANTAPAVAPLAMKLSVKSDTEHAKKGPDGQWHDAFLPGDFTVKAGQTVTVTVANYDDSAHTFTAPDLGVNARIAGGSATSPKLTTFTFKAPSKPGAYQWFCALPCDPWAMAHDGYMRGHVTVTA